MTGTYRTLPCDDGMGHLGMICHHATVQEAIAVATALLESDSTVHSVVIFNDRNMLVAHLERTVSVK